MTLPATGRLAGVLLALSALWISLWCGPALAHANLVGAEPSAGATLEEPPEQVRLSFSEPVDAEFSPVEVYDSQGDRVDRDDARVAPDDARVVEVGLLDDLDEGTYGVEWRVTSVDGHVVEGTYDFAVAEAQEGGADEGAGREEQPGAQEEPAEEGGENGIPILTYSVLSIGVLGVAALALLAVSRLRSRKP